MPLHDRARRLDSTAAALAVSGIVAPIWFTAVVILQGLLQPDYSHVVMPISALALWPYGWIQNVNFYVFGALMIAYALGLHLGMRSTRAGLLGPAVLMLSGVGIVLAGVFPLVRGADGAIVQTSSHVIPSILAFSCAGIGLVVVSRRMNRDAACCVPRRPFHSERWLEIVVVVSLPRFRGQVSAFGFSLQS